ncbi:MAG: hypothetical protein IJX05_04605, partial [Clostridia bacterium]|nr:hypothetical protein [Clostridia bacterium]
SPNTLLFREKVADSDRFFGDFARKSYAVGARPRGLPHGDKRIFKGKNEKDIVDACISGAPKGSVSGAQE